MAKPNIQALFLDDDAGDVLADVLAIAPASVTRLPLAGFLDDSGDQSCDCLLVAASHPPDDALQHGLTRRLKQCRTPVILCGDDEWISRCIADGAPVADWTSVGLHDHADLLLAFQHAASAPPVTASKTRLLAEHYARQLNLASRIQRDLHPTPLASHGRVRVSALFRPADFVSGDIYDVQQLNRRQLGLALADASGHSFPAALITAFIRRCLRAPESDAPLTPDAVLTRLNEELLGGDDEECRFVAAAYALIDIENLTVSVARGGTPYPVLRRVDGTTTLVRPHGSIIGVLPEAEFDVDEFTLAPGDELLLFSDGLEELVAPQLSDEVMAQAFARAGELLNAGRERAAVHDTQSVNGDNGRRRSSRRPPDEAILETSWASLLRARGAQAAIKDLILRHDALRRLGHSLDDLTVLCVSIADR